MSCSDFSVCLLLDLGVSVMCQLQFGYVLDSACVMYWVQSVSFAGFSLCHVVALVCYVRSQCALCVPFSAICRPLNWRDPILARAANDGVVIDSRPIRAL